MMLLWGIRFFLFKLYESPKYLMGKGADDKAVEVVHHVAAYNGKTSHLSPEDLASTGSLQKQNVGGGAALRRNLTKLDSNHVKSLFATRKLAWSTSLLVALWGRLTTGSVSRSLTDNDVALIGLAFPLCVFIFLCTKHPLTSRNSYNAFVTY